MAFANPFKTAKGGANPFLADEEATPLDLPVWQRNELLDQLGESSSNAVSQLFDAINYPGSIALDALSGSDIGSGTTPGKFLDTYGLRPGENDLGGWARPIAEFGVGATLDPLNLVTFGGGTLSRASQAAKAAGLGDDLIRHAGRRLVDDVASGARRMDDLGDFGHAANARRAMERSFRNKGDLATWTDDDLLSRPLVGSGTAARSTTLRQLVDNLDDPTDAIQKINHYLGRNYSQSYDDVADNLLGGDIGLNLPRFLGGPMSTTLPGGAATTAALDRAGQAIRWSRLGRGAHSLFNKEVLGTVDEGDQILARSWSRADKLADQRARASTGRLMRELREQAPDLFTNKEVDTAFRAAAEGTATSAQRQLVTASGLDPFVERWRQTRTSYIDRSRAAGVNSTELTDAYGTQYFPRGVDKELFQRGRAPVSGKREYTVLAGDQMARDEAYMVPGGTETLNRLSRDAGVTQAANDSVAADYIQQSINGMRQAGQPAYTRQQAMKLARDIRGLRQEALASGRGIFDSHSTEDWGRYIASRERAIERARVMTEALGSNANREHFTRVPGTGHSSINSVANDLGLRSTSYLEPTGGNFVQANRVHEGANVQILDAINARLPAGVAPLDVEDLANVSMDAAMVERFNRIADYYSTGEAPGLLLDFLDNLTRMWKSSVLAWPAKFARDWFGGAISNLIEVGDPRDMANGYAAAKALQQGQMDQLGALAAQMPRYAGLSPLEAANRFREEMVEFGLTGGRALEDLGTQFNARQMGTGMLDQFVPGSRPKTTFSNQVLDSALGRTPLPVSSAAYSELGNLRGYRDATSRFFRELGGSIAEINPSRFNEYLRDTELTDPILRWSAKLGDTTDEINRVAGYAGLMLQGVSPEEAVRRIMRAQVDYGSLTKFEREFMRRVIPFWTYNSRIGMYLAQEIWKHPGGAYSRASIRAPEALASAGGEDGEGYTPQQIRQNVGFSLEPFRDTMLAPLVNMIAPEKEGVNSYLNSIELPGTGLINMVNVKRDLDGTPQIGNSLFSTAMGTTSRLMHPLLRDSVEMLTGRNLHTGRTMVEYEPTIAKLGRGLGVQPHGSVDTALKYSNYLWDFIPHAPRVLQTANRLLDTTRVPDASARVTQSLFNALTGSKITPMSEDAARLDASRELTEMLGDSPYVRSFENRFIPEELLPYVSEQDLLLYRLDRQMRKEARTARKQAKKQSDPFANPFE